MLTTLLESKARKARNDRVTAASVTVHGVLIVIAAYATATASPASDKPDRTTQIIWTKAPIPTAAGAARPIQKLSHAPNAVVPVKQISISVDVAVAIPPVAIPLGAMTRSDFPQTATAGPGTPSDTSSTSGAAGERRAYTSNEVEFPVSAIAGNSSPDYPAALRSSGIEGQVTAQFVVDESGRVAAGTVRILSSTNDLFGLSVRRAVPRMRFTAARIGSHAVPQLVQQLFVFRLGR